MNLIVTCARNMEDEAAGEMAGILAELGDGSAEARRTGMSGIITVRTAVPHANLGERIRAMAEDEPWSLRYILRVIPVERTVATSLDGITGACAGYREAIGNSAYRVTIETRHSDLSTSDLISAIAGKMAGRVSLEDPDMEILVEILGAQTGIALARRGDVISVPKLKRMQ